MPVLAAVAALMVLAACGGASQTVAEATTAPVATAAAEPTAESAPTDEPPTAEPEPPSVPPPSEELLHLWSGEWQWIAYAGPMEEFSIETPGNYRVTFNDDATFTAVADCNNLAGNYVAGDGGEITITPGPMTLAACPEGSRSDQFVAFLGSAARYYSDGDNLILELMADGGTMTFAPAGDATGMAGPASEMAADALLDTLRNLTYPGPFPDDSITLTGGRGFYDDGSSGEPYVRLIDQMLVTGDLDGDGTQDALTLLEDNSSGTGRFVFLTAVLDALGNPQPTTAVMLGDRIGVKSLQMDGSNVVADLISQGTSDAACCAGSNTRQVWALVDGQLVQQSDEELSRIAVSDLDGTSWQLVGYNGLEEPVPADVTITAEFGDGQISGSAGCNTYSATVSAVEGDLPNLMAVGPIATTQKACEDTIMQQEQRYLARLQTAGAWLWGYEPGFLSLGYTTEEGSPGQLVFEPAAAAGSATGTATLPDEIATQLDAFLQSQVYTEGGIPAGAAPGLVLYVKTPDGTYLNAAGVASLEDGTPMQGDDILEIGSNTKSMTIVLLMQLVEQGQISLDDPLSKWLPEQAAAFPNGDQITIRQMAQHTAGLWDYADDLIGDGAGDPDALVAAFTPEEMVQFAADNGTPYFAPGAEGQWKYSNTGYVLLGMIIEQITGQPIGELMQSRIFDPLGMETAVFLEGVPQPGQITTQGYFWPGDGERVNTTNWNASQGWAAGAAAMTAPDLATYGRALAAGELFQNVDTLNEMLTFYEPAQFGVGGPYGLGLIDFAGDGTVWGHGGQTLGFQSLWYVDPAQDIVVVGLSNSATYSANALLNVYQILMGSGALPFTSGTLLPAGVFSPSNWRWVRFDGPGGSTDVDAADGLIMSMSKDQSVLTISAECGNTGGTFTVDPSQGIDFDIDASTLTCDPESAAGQFVQYLNDAVSWRFDNGNLIINLPEEGGSMVFNVAVGG
jgi:D-alanyl-D-alanine carboxypeptidase